MKKIIGAAAAGLVLTGAAFADISFSGNGRFRADAFSYQSPNNKDRSGEKADKNGEGTDDNGTFKIANLTDVTEDVKLNAKSENAGAALTFTVTGPGPKLADTSSGNGTVNMKTYQLWLNFGKLRLDAGTYDKRLVTAINNDGKWVTNLSGTNKPGIWTAFDGVVWGKDAGNIAVVANGARINNIMATYDVNDNLSVNGLVFFSKDENITGNAADDNWSSNIWKMAPFALGATYKLDKNSKVVVVGKMLSYTNSTEKAPQNSVWLLHGNYYSKLNSNLEIEAAYTLGASVYTNNGNFHDTGKGNDWVQINHMKAQDKDVFAHGFDFRVRDKLNSQLSLVGIVGVNYVQSSEATRRENRHPSDATRKKYKDARARSYGEKAAGTLAYYTTVSADYAMTDTITLQFQGKLQNTDVFATSPADSRNRTTESVDYWKNTELILRPAVKFNANSNCYLNTGLEVTFKKGAFRDHATSSRNVFNTKIAVPLVFLVTL